MLGDNWEGGGISKLETKKEKELGICSSTGEKEVILDSDFFLMEVLEEWLDTASGCLGKPDC